MNLEERKAALIDALSQAPEIWAPRTVGLVQQAQTEEELWEVLGYPKKQGRAKKLSATPTHSVCPTHARVH